ncbi:PKD domain-containing protein [Pedobacter gandavensis]|uniref:PKD domain-containing protein n=1 Tax=Pedobacter gandavensis TaxID=2679963 RepID=UPI0029309368|nr:PKD domain-containing protein [Pedobacter gandavensis]
MAKRSLLLTLVVFFTTFLNSYSQIVIGTVDPGPYTPGSSIAATFKITEGTCLRPGNVFELYLSDNTGSFNANNRIGTYTGFYATFVNGTIPNGTPAGTGYKLQIRSTQQPALNSTSASFEIKNGTVAIAALSSVAKTISENPLTFGTCNSNPGTTPFNLSNESTSDKVTATITDELDGGTASLLTYTPVIKNNIFTAKQAHYTILAKVEMPDGSIGTQAYFLINNPAITAFTTTSGSTVCYPTGSFEYVVTVDGPNGINRNFPGNTYKIDWGDTKVDIYTICDIKTGDNKVRHTFTESSCGKVYQSGSSTKYNVFGINVNLESPFCTRIGTPISTIAGVFTRPTNKFAYSPVGCKGSVMTFINESTPGKKGDEDSPGCNDNTLYYTWSINDEPVEIDKLKSYNFTHIFTEKGTYKITLTSTTQGSCQAEIFERTICIQDPPEPKFDLSSTKICLTPGTITTTDRSILDNSCGTTPAYTWNVSPAQGVTFIDANGKNGKEPQIKFTQPGEYSISLTISNGGCAKTSAIQKVIVDGEPLATLSPDIELCAKGTFTFGPNGSETNTLISGTAKDDIPGTYTWEVTGGAYAFVAPNGATSKYPVIDFKDYGVYTIKLTYTNNCNTIIRQQKITFTEAPVPSIFIDPDPICYAADADLEGRTTNDNYVSSKWSVPLTGGGTFSSPDNKITSYTPTAQERINGKATVIFTLTTNLAGDCKTISRSKEITIFPNNTRVNATKTICTGSPVDYVLTSSISGSSFTWTSQLTSGTATGNSFGSGGTIDETIINTDPLVSAVIVYTITPKANNCDGTPFKLTVTVVPKPVITANPVAPEICSGSSTGITLSTNLPGGTTYKWTSVSSAPLEITGNQHQTTATTSNVINQILTNNGTTRGTVTYTITPYSSGTDCPGQAVIVIVQVDPKVTTATAGQNKEFCGASSYTLEGNEPRHGTETGLWTLVSGQTGLALPAISDPTLYNTQVTGLSAGETFRFRWTITGSGQCPANFSEVEIKINLPTIAGVIDGTATVCEGRNNGVLNLTRNTGAVVKWQSSIDETSWTDIANTSASLSYTNITGTTYYRAIVKNGTCAEEFTNVIKITVNPADTKADAGAPQELCNQGTTVLAGNMPIAANGESGLWTVISSTPNVEFSDATSPTASAKNLEPGTTYVFRWTITGNSACGPTSDEVKVTNLPEITNVISTDNGSEVCNGKTITLDDEVSTGGNRIYTYKWESSTDGTNFVTLPETSASLTYTLTNTLTFRRTMTSGACQTLSNTIRMIAQEPISGNTITADQTICSGVSPIGLTGSTPTGSDNNFFYQWQSSTNGTAWTDLPGEIQKDYTNILALNNTTYYRRVVKTLFCDGALTSMSNPVKVTVKPNAKAEFTWVLDKGCNPFDINITTVPYPDRNASYTWSANGVVIGTGVNFPGYKITESNKTVNIKLVTTSSQGCTDSAFDHDFSTIQEVPASFTQNVQEGCGPLTVKFFNNSVSLTGATFHWDFGNGTISSLIQPEDVIFLADPTGKDKTYTITLTATTACGNSTFNATVLVKAKPIAVFSPSKTVGCSPMLVNFTNTSPGGTNTYTYDFGDGSPTVTTTSKLPQTHTYNTTVTKTFVVIMTAVNECGTDTKTYNIQVSPQNITPELVVDAKEKKGCAPLTVNFDNNSIGATRFTFDFGDGGALNTTEPGIVQYIFTKPGKYTVKMTAFNDCSEITEEEEIEVLEQPLAAFHADITLGCAGLAVQFKNTTQDGFSYVWDFGDGTTSKEFEPKHVYSGDQEYYTVTLTATNILGCSISVSRNQYIRIVPPPVAAFYVNPSTLISIPDYTFKFEDESTGSPSTWAWDFGDGTTSEKQHPIHTYPDTGTYKVTLTTFNQQGCFTSTFKHVTIKGVPGYLFVPNSFIPGSEFPELRTFSAKGSGIASWKFSVFNKWAELVWETTKLDEGRPAEGWDGNFKGSPAPQGVYYWKIDVKMINGTEWKGMTYDKSAPKRTGAIHLIR